MTGIRESSATAELIHEHAVHVRTPEGVSFVVRTFGQRQQHGIWIGWLEFDPGDGHGPILRTKRETGQASREALRVWATGLGAAYVEGAFKRAEIVNAA